MLHPSLRRAVVAAGAVPVVALAMSSPSYGTATSASPSPITPSPTAAPLRVSSVVSADKAPSSALAKTPESLLKRTDSAPVNVMIKYDYDASASYTGGVGSLPATSPSKTGKKLTGKSSAEQAYAAYQAGRERSISAAVKAAAPAATLGQSFRVVYGGVAATVPANTVKDIVKVDGVVAVQPDVLRQPLTDSSSDFINATNLQNSLGGAAGPKNAGRGVIYGNLDTGVWPEHPSFADLGNLGAPPAKADGTPRTCNFGDNPLTPATDVFQCNNKLISGQPFLATYLSNPDRADDELYTTARDSNGHGTHTSSTSAGNVVAVANPLGVNHGPIRGIAPGAWLAEYRVCGVHGCFNSDSMAAVGQAILDGVTVINFSISGGTDPFTDPVELAFLDAYAAGVFVSTSAGNDGPGAGTVNHLSPWVTSVAASTQTREFATTLNLSASDGATLAVDGASITQGAGPAPVVLASAAPYNSALCATPAPPGIFVGKIVACQRGGNARVDKGFNVRQGGAAGMILYNATLADTETDNHWLPTVHLADGTSFLAFFNGHTGVTAQFAAGEKRNGEGDVMAAFSSRGPGGPYIKPDVTAPGVQILAGMTPTPESITEGPPGNYFQAIAGTSMSSPHVAGAAILLRAAHPTWTPGQIRSALMTSAKTTVVKENLTTPADPFDMGAGRIDVGAAAAATLTLDESADDFFALGQTALTGIDLNIPSVNAPTMPGSVTTTRTVTNVTNVTQKFNVVTSAPGDSAITVSPNQFNLEPGLSRTLTITITSDAPIGAQRFGTIRLVPKTGGVGLHLPVAFVHQQADVTLAQSCAPTTVNINGQSVCTVTATNKSAEDVNVTSDTSFTKNLKFVSTSGAVQTDARAVRATATLVGNRPGVPDVAPGSLAGYIPLDLFGGTLVSPIGDEQIINLDVPSFNYTGRTFNRVGVDSNGYVIAGGGTSEDNNCCSLPDNADPAPPNNMLAPFWTDLDGTGAPGILANVLTDGVNTWLVVEYRVNVFGTSSLRVFQTWIGVDGTEDITYAYDPARLPAAPPPGQKFLVGAENEFGDGDMTATLPTGDLRVTSSAPTPGGTLTYSVTVAGKEKGTGVVTTGLTSPSLPGTTIVRSEVKVQ